MKLPNFLDDTRFSDLRARMGAAPLSSLHLVPSENRLTIAELEELISGGIDIQSLDDVRTLQDGTLAYKDRRVLLYIRDVTDFGISTSDLGALPKYHLANCTTLQEMRGKKRMDRYVVAARRDGQFSLNLIKGPRRVRSQSVSLSVCQNCLALLEFDHFALDLPSRKRKEMVAEFSPGRFFSRYPRDLIDAQNVDGEESAPLNNYTENFESRAAEIKDRCSHKCAECGLDLSAASLRRFLHVHHRNGIKYDNSEINLVALCFGCHSKQDGHAHMRRGAEFEDFKRKLPRRL